ncbi:MAG TPA: aminodeoxychorismate synthase component I [Tepidiformaceae bacterium]|nr:aminodeoxychorismate synthase component I [Tepidiformaceae bacterium]
MTSGCFAVLQLDGAWFQLTGATEPLVAHSRLEVAPLLARVERLANGGAHAAGFVAYEAAAAYGLDAHAPVPGLPLAAFVVGERLEPFDPSRLVEAAARVPAIAWRPGIDEGAYAGAVRRVREYLAAGESYQVNLTFPLEAAFTGDPFALFARLARAQRADGAAYLDLGRFAVCSASPELFLARDRNRVLMRPMKGTANRGRTNAEDRRKAVALRASPKERAENLMIVDMVRNDLGRVARIGSVDVPALFRVERFPTVLQMTSDVTAETDVPLGELFAATFPCASVTGAPKVRTASIIKELEGRPRGVYTGAVGYVGPGGRARFNVAIRTATVDRAAGTATYHVGSGIVWDSRPGREYAECLAKARVLERDVTPFALIETLRWTPGEGFVLLKRHLDRLRASARYFGFPFDRRKVRRALGQAVGGCDPLRVRLLLDEWGALRVETSALAAGSPARVTAGLALAPVDAASPFLFHKTTRRAVYEDAAASRPDCEEVILWNRAGYVTETCLANIAVYAAGRWVTPPVADGLLAGTMRAELLARGEIVEGQIPVGSLHEGTRLAAFNSVRGWRELRFVPAPGKGRSSRFLRPHG